MSERLRWSDDGQVLWRLPRPWRDGTTHVRFDPCHFLGRLAVLVRRPRINLLFYHGTPAEHVSGDVREPSPQAG